MIQRRTPLKRTPLRKVSKKRAKESRIYMQKRKAFLKAHPICQVYLAENERQITRELLMDGEARIETKFLSTDIHHRKGRTGTNYLDESTWLACSREMHEKIHREPKWARARGYLLT